MLKRNCRGDENVCVLRSRHRTKGVNELSDEFLKYVGGEEGMRNIKRTEPFKRTTDLLVRRGYNRKDKPGKKFPGVRRQHPGIKTPPKEANALLSTFILLQSGQTVMKWFYSPQRPLSVYANPMAN